MPDWTDSRFTGLFRQFTRIAPRPHDPAVAIAAAEIPAWSPHLPPLGSSGAGWTQAEADQACLGEAIERWLPFPLRSDGTVEAAHADWPLDEPAMAPDRFVLFHRDQYTQQGFPLAPFTPQTRCRWTCCRSAATGEAVWVPEELVFLQPRPGQQQRISFGFSTGLSSGTAGMPVLLRGVQEVIERDALVGGWWGQYPVEEWPLSAVRTQIGEPVWERLDRQNLTYRLYRIDSPFSSHVTLASIAGVDREGFVYSVGSACRETRATSWRKSLLEAVQGRHCVRQLLSGQKSPMQPADRPPTTFFEHALYYALNPQCLEQTVLHRVAPPSSPNCGNSTDNLSGLVERLGPDRPVLFRDLTPPDIRGESPEWHVLRVVIPGLQPLHADHRVPFLGGPLWGARPVNDWQHIPPHPFA